MRATVYVRKAMIAVLAGLAGGIATVTVGIATDFLAEGRSWAIYDIQGLALFVVIFTIPGAILLTIIDWLLPALKRTSAIDYGAVTAAASISLGLLVMLFTGNNALHGLPESWSNLIRPVVLFTANGTVAGLAFWMLRRRARIEPPLWTDVF